MYHETVDQAATMSAKKVNFLKQNPFGYLVASGLSGIYIGFGIALIFSLGAPFAAAGSPAVKLVMGACFGIALTLAIFAGCELFTSNVMFMVFGLAKRKLRFIDAINVWTVSWVGAFLGSVLLAYMVVVSGAVAHAYPLFAKVASAKMSADALELFTRGILCNMLVCLAAWISLRTLSDTAKILVIFWCLFGFIGAGYEHSVANMGLIAIALMSNPEAANLTLSGFGHNLLWVTLGNFVGGAIMIATPYIIASRQCVDTEAVTQE